MPNGVTFTNVGGGGASLALDNTEIFVGNASNVAAGVPLTLNATGGAFSLANTGVLTMPNANATTRGLLTAADWANFNGKQASIPDWQTAFGSGTQATSSWSAINAEANVNAAIVPKGTGAVLTALPDGTAVGGNARGAYATDLQHHRAIATQVASGNNSTIGGGRDNSVLSVRSVVGGGFTNTITSGESSVISGGASNTVNVAATGISFIGGGTLNSITGAGSVIGGGRSNTVTGTDSVIVGGNSNSTGSSLQSFIGGGFSNETFNNYSVICGGYNNTSVGTSGFVGGGQSNNHTAGSYAVLVGGDSNYINADWSTLAGGYLNQINATFGSVGGGRQANAYLYGMQAYSSGQFSALADAQMATLQMRRAITGTAISDLYLDGTSVIPILAATNTIWMARIQVVAVCTAQGNGTVATGAAYVTERHVGIKRLNTTTSLIGSVQTIGTAQADATMTTNVVTITADDTNEALRVQYTPPTTAGTTSTFRVVATIQLTQIKY